MFRTSALSNTPDNCNTDDTGETKPQIASLYQVQSKSFLYTANYCAWLFHTTR